MPVEKTAVHEDDGLAFCKYEVGLAREPSIVKPVSVPQRMNNPANKPFRAGILAAHTGHSVAALCGVRVSIMAMYHKSR